MEKTVDLVINPDKFMEVCDSAKANIKRDTMKAVQQQMENYLKKEFATFQDATFVKEHRKCMEDTWKDMKGEILEQLWLLKDDTAKEREWLYLNNEREKEQLLQHQQELKKQ